MTLQVLTHLRFWAVGKDCCGNRREFECDGATVYVYRKAVFSYLEKDQSEFEYSKDMGPYGPIWAHMGPYGPIWAHTDRSWQVRTCPISDFWSKFAHFGSKTCFLMKFLNDSASFLPEKHKNHVILTKHPNT